jgi:hypothetical protein
MTSSGGFITVSLRLNGLNRVWARRLACVDGYFVLHVNASAPATESGAEVIRWERSVRDHSVRVAAPCWISRRDGKWQLLW